MAARYELTSIDKNAEQGPLFRIGRDVYVRERKNQRVIRLKAVESYNVSGVSPAVEAFRACAEVWKAPVVFIIEPDLKKPPAARFLYEWSRTSHSIGSVDRCFMKTSNFVTRAMGGFVLKIFTDGTMPFEALDDERLLQSRLDGLDLSCNRPGFALKQPGALVVYRNVADSFFGFLVGRMLGRRRGHSDR